MMFIPYLNLYPFSEKLSETKDNLFNYYTKEIQKKFHKIIGGIENNKNIEVNDKMGYYMHGFKLSIYYLKKISQIDPTKEKDLYYKIMCNICNLGGDTDTNCAIVGTMIGPLLGYENCHSQLFDRFIKYFPDNRTQYTSAFMYIYVNYLEEKYLYNSVYNDKKDTNPSYNKLKEFLTKNL